MGYDFHITRRDHWAESDSGPAISKEEFHRVLSQDSRFFVDPDNGPDFYTWKSGGEFDDSPWLSWSQEGEVFSKPPSEDFIPIMVAIAAKFNAKVQGDDGEEYGPDGNINMDVVESPHAAANSAVGADRIRKRNALLGLGTAILIAVALLIVIRLTRGVP